MTPASAKFQPSCFRTCLSLTFAWKKIFIIYSHNAFSRMRCYRNISKWMILYNVNLKWNYFIEEYNMHEKNWNDKHVTLAYAFLPSTGPYIYLTSAWMHYLLVHTFVCSVYFHMEISVPQQIRQKMWNLNSIEKKHMLGESRIMHEFLLSVHAAIKLPIPPSLPSTELIQVVQPTRFANFACTYVGTYAGYH